MMGNMQKVENGSITVQLKGGGPLGTVLAVSDAEGNVRGYVQNPQISLLEKYRGKLAHVIDAYVRDMEADLLRARPERVFITHSGCSREIVESVRAYLTGLHHFDQVLETRAGGVISSHCGPGTLGVLFIVES